MILTIAVGRDLVCQPLPPMYGQDRLPRLLDGYESEEEQFWAKGTVWSKTERDHALATKGSQSIYSLAMFVLRPQS